jgi:Undecaprenyl-phosphate galactose phosphotransferase WbaP
MLTRRQIIELSRIVLIVSDLVSVIIPAFVIYNFRDSINGEFQYRDSTLIAVSIFAMSILISSQTVFEQYTVRRSFYDEIVEFVQLYLFSALASLSMIYIFELSEDRKKHLIFLFFTFILIPIFRYLSRHALDYFGLWRVECLLLSPQSEFDYAKRAIESQFNLGLNIRRSSLENRLLVKYIKESERVDASDYRGFQIKLQEYYQSIFSPYIIIYLHKKNSEYLPKVVELLSTLGFNYSIIPDVSGSSLLGARISHLFRWEVLLITPRNNIDRVSYKIIKRFFDIILATFMLFIMFVPMVIIYLIIKRDGGPGIFSHERIGLNGGAFKCYKFRSMTPNSEMVLDEYLANDSLARSHWTENRKLIYDPRITKFGKFLREYSLDELPQLLNVIRGDMSMIGPRPIVKSEILKYGKNFDVYKKVRPGITGLWQISGRSSTAYSYRVSLDIWYIKNWSFWYDIFILMKTVGVVISRTGAH